jgi:hypothetical protein
MITFWRTMPFFISQKKSPDLKLGFLFMMIGFVLLGCSSKKPPSVKDYAELSEEERTDYAIDQVRGIGSKQELLIQTTKGKIRTIAFVKIQYDLQDSSLKNKLRPIIGILKSDTYPTLSKTFQGVGFQFISPQKLKTHPKWRKLKSLHFDSETMDFKSPKKFLKWFNSLQESLNVDGVLFVSNQWVPQTAEERVEEIKYDTIKGYTYQMDNTLKVRLYLANKMVFENFAVKEKINASWESKSNDTEALAEIRNTPQALTWEFKYQSPLFIDNMPGITPANLKKHPALQKTVFAYYRQTAEDFQKNHITHAFDAMARKAYSDLSNTVD